MPHGKCNHAHVGVPSAYALQIELIGPPHNIAFDLSNTDVYVYM